MVGVSGSIPLARTTQSKSYPVSFDIWGKLGTSSVCPLRPQHLCEGSAALIPLDDRHRSGRLVDAWLAALALSLDYEMTTLDRGFKSFRGPKLRLLTTLEEYRSTQILLAVRMVNVPSSAVTSRSFSATPGTSARNTNRVSSS